MDIKGLEQKYNDLDRRLSKVEDCLRDANRRSEEFSEALDKFRKGTLSQTDAQLELGD